MTAITKTNTNARNANAFVSTDFLENSCDANLMTFGNMLSGLSSNDPELLAKRAGVDGSSSLALEELSSVLRVLADYAVMRDNDGARLSFSNDNDFAQAISTVSELVEVCRCSMAKEVEATKFLIKNRQ